jgi:hypothetical protein
MKSKIATACSAVALTVGIFLALELSVEWLYQPAHLGYPNPVRDYRPLDSMSVKDFLFSPSTDKTPVTITLNGKTHLSIPRNYLHDAASINPYPHMRINILVKYPTFSPVEGKQALHPTDSENVIRISRVGETAEFIKSNRARWLDRIVKEVGPLDKNPHIDVGGISEQVVSATSQSDVLLFTCPASNAPHTAQDVCFAHLAVTPDFVVEYSFRPSLMPHAHEIGDGVKNLLDSFVVK